MPASLRHAILTACQRIVRSNLLLAERELQPAIPNAPRVRTLPRVPSLYAVAAFALLAALVLVALAPRFDPDFWWHLKVGQYIAQHHAVPSRDFMSYVFAGHPWTDHEWLTELLMYGAFRVGGVYGPVVLFAAVIGGAYLLVYLVMVDRHINRLLAMGVLLLAAVASSGSWGPRVQMVTLLFLATYMFVLHRFEISRDRRLLVAFPGIMLLWANMHGGFVIGLALLTITLFGEFLNERAHHEGAFSRDDLRALGVTLIASGAVTLINPNGVRQLLYPLTFIRPNAFTNLIQESASPNFHVVIMMVFEAMLLALVAALYAGRHPVNWTHLLLIIAFTYLAFSQIRNVPVWCVVLAPLLARYVQDTLGWSYRDRHLSGGIKSVVNLIFVVLILAGSVRGAMYLSSQASIQQYENHTFPVGAVKYLRTHSLPPHVLVAYTWGGYLLWNLFPRYRDYMDSRADTLYTATILDNYLTMFGAGPGWRAALKQAGVQDVLLPPSAPLIQVLAEDHAWRLAYRGSSAVIYTLTSF